MTFYFYDLETSSASPRTGRIMQFAGQRTNELMEPIGDPDDIIVKLADDIIPEPDAVLVHGITPQKTLEEGINEAEFAEFFHEKVAQPATVFIGYNNIRFDDEFMRKLCYRAFYDPYQWHWKDGRSRWDLLDPIRMMRALRPYGLKWPMLEGRPSVKLELMAKENGIIHENAHDALSDVVALIELAKRFNDSQPRLFKFLLDNRDKRSVAKIAESGVPFVYTSGRLSYEHEKTSVAQTLFKHPRRDAAIIYDLRQAPERWLDKSVEELVKHWQPAYGEDIERLPVKVMQYNKSPAIAPTGVLDKDSRDRIGIDMEKVVKHQKVIAQNSFFIDKLKKVLDIVENEQQAKFDLGDESVDDQLYSGFWSTSDGSEMLKIRMSDVDEFSALQLKVNNKRLREMMPLYKARNFPDKLNSEEREAWEAHKIKALTGGGKNSRFAKFSERMHELGSKSSLGSNEEYLLTELQLYVESIMPEPEEDI